MLRPDVPHTEVTCSMADLGPISLQLVTEKAERRLWEAMIDTHHPQGWARSPGGQLKYWIVSQRWGILGGIGFGSATHQLRARGVWIGWSATARFANIQRVLCNHRFLILPGVRVYGLASQVLRLATQGVADDWNACYSEQPLAVYSHVGAQYSGYSYHRAGWRTTLQVIGSPTDWHVGGCR